MHFSSFSKLLSYDGLRLSAVAGLKNKYPYAPVSVTIFGILFGLFDESPSVRIGFTACEETLWSSQSTLICRISSGASNNDHVTVTSNSQLNTISRIFVYDFPSISSTSPQNSATSDLVQTSVFGLNFGRMCLSNTLRFGRSQCEVSLWVSDTVMLCKPAAGIYRQKGQIPVVLSSGVLVALIPTNSFFTLTQVIFLAK
jgi:hypothetical protein